MSVTRMNLLSLILGLVFAHQGLWSPANNAPQNPAPVEQTAATSSSMSFEVSYDSWTSSNTSETNNGDDVDLWVGVFSYGTVKVERRMLLWFDISGLPAGAIMDSATLELSQTRADGAESYQIWPHEVSGNWQEDEVTWQNAPPYISAGDPATTVDYESGVYKLWDVTKIVQSWLAGAENNGILLAGDGTTVGTRVFRSRENISEPGLLTITYHMPENTTYLYLPLVGR
jgi:hypothetical protein